jgi:hypothetical protein
MGARLGQLIADPLEDSVEGLLIFFLFSYFPGSCLRTGRPFRFSLFARPLAFSEFFLQAVELKDKPSDMKPVLFCQITFPLDSGFQLIEMILEIFIA